MDEYEVRTFALKQASESFGVGSVEAIKLAKIFSDFILDGVVPASETPDIAGSIPAKDVDA